MPKKKKLSLQAISLKESQMLDVRSQNAVKKLHVLMQIKKLHYAHKTLTPELAEEMTELAAFRSE